MKDKGFKHQIPIYDITYSPNPDEKEEYIKSSKEESGFLWDIRHCHRRYDEKKP
ncbi:MAG: hypothetical protein ACOX6S_12285 [Clostridia bacterium]|jgi:hypothetical protein